MAFIADKEVAKAHAQSWNSEFKPPVEPSRPNAADGVEAATSAQVADAFNWALDQELAKEEASVRADARRR